MTGGWSGKVATSASRPPTLSTYCRRVESSMSLRFSRREIVSWPTARASARSAWVCFALLRSSFSVTSGAASSTTCRWCLASVLAAPSAFFLAISIALRLTQRGELWLERHMQ